MDCNIYICVLNMYAFAFFNVKHEIKNKLFFKFPYHLVKLMLKIIA